MVGGDRGPVPQRDTAPSDEDFPWRWRTGRSRTTLLTRLPEDQEHQASPCGRGGVGPSWASPERRADGGIGHEHLCSPVPCGMDISGRILLGGGSLRNCPRPRKPSAAAAWHISQGPESMGLILIDDICRSMLSLAGHCHASADGRAMASTATAVAAEGTPGSSSGSRQHLPEDEGNLSGNPARACCSGPEHHQHHPAEEQLYSSVSMLYPENGPLGGLVAAPR